LVSSVDLYSSVLIHERRMAVFPLCRQISACFRLSLVWHTWNWRHPFKIHNNTSMQSRPFIWIWFNFNYRLIQHLKLLISLCYLKSAWKISFSGLFNNTFRREYMILYCSILLHITSSECHLYPVCKTLPQSLVTLVHFLFKKFLITLCTRISTYVAIKCYSCCGVETAVLHLGLISHVVPSIH
jgi:hypothetical protein